MSKHISDDQMRSLWRQRCQARREIEANHKVIQDQTTAERTRMRKCEREIFWATRDLERGLRQRPDRQFRANGAVLLLDHCGSLVPVWDWMPGHPDPRWRDHAANLMGRREAVAC